MPVLHGPLHAPHRRVDLLAGGSPPGAEPPSKLRGVGGRRPGVLFLADGRGRPAPDQISALGERRSGTGRSPGEHPVRHEAGPDLRREGGDRGVPRLTGDHHLLRPESVEVDSGEEACRRFRIDLQVRAGDAQDARGPGPVVLPVRRGRQRRKTLEHQRGDGVGGRRLAVDEGNGWFRQVRAARRSGPEGTLLLVPERRDHAIGEGGRLLQEPPVERGFPQREQALGEVGVVFEQARHPCGVHQVLAVEQGRRDGVGRPAGGVDEVGATERGTSLRQGSDGQPVPGRKHRVVALGTDPRGSCLPELAPYRLGQVLLEGGERARLHPLLHGEERDGLGGNRGDLLVGPDVETGFSLLGDSQRPRVRGEMAHDVVEGLLGHSAVQRCVPSLPGVRVGAGEHGVAGQRLLEVGYPPFPVVGMAVEAAFEDVSPEVTLVVFRPASS